MPRLLFFGQLRERARDLHDQAVAIDARSVANVLAWIKSRDADLAGALAAKGVRIAVDQKFAAFDTLVAPNSEIAFMSPLSGG